MQPDPNFGTEDIATEIIRGVIDTVVRKPGLSPERHAAAMQTVVCLVMAFNPRDPVETMMAGQCIVYDHLLRDGARDMLHGKAELEMIKARPGVLACGKMFLATVAMLIRVQRRPELALAFARRIEAPPEQPAAETEAPPVEAAADAAASSSERPESSAAPRPVPIQPLEAITTRARQPAQPATPASPRQPDRPAVVSPGQLVSNPILRNGLPHPLMPPGVEAFLFDGIDEQTKQEIMAVASQAVRESEFGKTLAAVGEGHAEGDTEA